MCGFFVVIFFSWFWALGVFPQVYLFFCCFLKVIPRYHTSLCQTRRPLSSIQQHLGTCLSLLSLSGCSGSVSGMHRAVLAKVCRMLKANCSVQVWNTHKWVFPHSLRAEPAPAEAPGSGVLVLLWAPALLLTGTESQHGFAGVWPGLHPPTARGLTNTAFGFFLNQINLLPC